MARKNQRKAARKTLTERRANSKKIAARIVKLASACCPGDEYCACGSKACFHQHGWC